MRGTLICGLLALAGLQARERSNSHRSADDLLADLPGVDGSDFRVAPYIRSATALQALGKERAFEQLRAMAKAEQPGGTKVIILCRMLFRAKSDWQFRRPLLGEPGFFGRTLMMDWPLEPIEVVDGVPLLITYGDELNGQPETAIHYLEYCLETCH